MKAMILAAGYGTRLKPLTDTLPKALVPVKGKPMIDYQVERLKSAGVNSIAVNAHHHSEKLSEYFRENDFGINVSVIHEDIILGTGGGVLNAENFFKEESFFVVMNVDIDTDFLLKPMIDYHKKEMPYATLGVQKRKTKRYVEIGSDMQLKGRALENTPAERQYAFNGIHIISSEFFTMGFVRGYSDILDLHIKAVESGERIMGYDMGNAFFKDLGKIEDYKI
jgi:NDP-sugar pyrophosphorylase family protein